MQQVITATRAAVIGHRTNEASPALGDDFYGGADVGRNFVLINRPPLALVSLVRSRGGPDVDVISLQCQVWVVRPALVGHQAEAEHTRVEVSSRIEFR